MISDEQWAAIEHLFPKNVNRQGRKPVDGRGVVDGILWVLNQGERWHNLPKEYPAAQTCYNRWLEWRRSGIWQEIVDAIGIDACTSFTQSPARQQRDR